MKKPLPVTLDDLQATARDDRDGLCVYRKLEVQWNSESSMFTYRHDHWPCSKQFAIGILSAYEAMK